jgi:hypothetical protein
VTKVLKKVTYCASMVLVYKELAIKNWELGTKSVASLPKTSIQSDFKIRGFSASGGF